MNKIGQGVAIAGIWIGVAVMSFSPVVAGQLVTLAGIACAATFFTAWLL